MTKAIKKSLGHQVLPTNSEDNANTSLRIALENYVKVPLLSS